MPADGDTDADGDGPEPLEVERREILGDVERLLEVLGANGDWRSRPIGETVARLCADLGLAPDNCVERELIRQEKRASSRFP